MLKYDILGSILYTTNYNYLIFQFLQNNILLLVMRTNCINNINQHIRTFSSSRRGELK